MKNLTILASTLLLACCGDGGGNPTFSSGQVGADVTTIGDVQGRVASSPLQGQAVRIIGVVTGDFQDNDADAASNLGGFYVQQESPDSDPLTSDGVFVFDGSNPATDVSVGDRVEVAGIVAEFFGETQVNADRVTKTGTGVIESTDVQLPTAGMHENSDGDAIADLEAWEGMLVRFPQELSVSNLRYLEPFGSLGLSEGGRLQQFTNGNPPDAEEYQSHKRNNLARSIVLDDGLRSQNPKTFRYLPVRAGDSVINLTGNLRYSRGSGGSGPETWRLMPTREPQLESKNPRPDAPSIAGGFRVASLNVLNFFSGIDKGLPACGPGGSDRCRGADSAAELDRQLQKTVSALSLLDADVIGLVELENNASESIATITDALNARLGAKAYEYVDTGTIHDDAIKTGFLYRPATTQPIGNFALLDNSVDAQFNDDRNRPALAQTFAVTGSGARLTISINHLKSKGSDCAAEGDPNIGDGQGNCNLTRTNAAIALADWVASDPTDSSDPDFLILGDLNAYLHEDPLRAMKSAGLVSLLDSRTAVYSFLFDAQIGALDHAVASATLATQVAEVMEWHINADEAPLLDYNLENDRDPELFDGTTPWRSSDHDPIVVGLDLTE